MGSERIPLRRLDSEASLPTEETWRIIQTEILDRPLDEWIRELVGIATVAYSLFGSTHSDENTVLSSELMPALESWMRATANLRRTLRLTVQPQELRFGRAEVILPFAEHNDIRSYGKMLPLELLAVSVASATAAASVALDEIGKGAGARIRNDLWSAWVCLVAIYLSRAGVKPTASSGNKPPKESPFVKVIQLLQSSLPPSCQRFTGSDEPYESITNGIKRARRTLGKLNEKQLLLILAGWGSSVLTGYGGPLESSSATDIVEFSETAERKLEGMKRVAEASSEAEASEGSSLFEP